MAVSHLRAACTAPLQPLLDAWSATAVRGCSTDADTSLDDLTGCRDSRCDGSMDGAAKVRREAATPLCIACQVPAGVARP